MLRDYNCALRDVCRWSLGAVAVQEMYALLHQSVLLQLQASQKQLENTVANTLTLCPRFRGLKNTEDLV